MPFKLRVYKDGKYRYSQSHATENSAKNHLKNLMKYFKDKKEKGWSAKIEESSKIIHRKGK